LRRAGPRARAARRSEAEQSGAGKARRNGVMAALLRRHGCATSNANVPLANCKAAGGALADRRSRPSCEIGPATGSVNRVMASAPAGVPAIGTAAT
jgi:hypothetical protein